MTDSIEKLIELFNYFPGVGKRQARRFVYFLLKRDSLYLNNLSVSIKNLKIDVSKCLDCERFYLNNNASKICNICTDSNRNTNLLMVVEKDIDLENINRTGTYDGYYFVLGGLVPILEKDIEKKIRLKSLKNIINKKVKDGLKEIIVALAVHPDGDNTSELIKNELEDIVKVNKIKLTTLGRGLSTGTELEYSDSETLKNALKNRG